MDTKYYAGIGSRETPPTVLGLMVRIAKQLDDRGFVLRSGGAGGADQAFAAGAINTEIFLPWNGFNGAHGIIGVSEAGLAMAAKYHPAWSRLSQGAQKLMARNCAQVLGKGLQAPSAFVVCWTPDGAEARTTIKTGGTGQAIRIAIDHGIPVINLKNAGALDRIASLLFHPAPKDGHLTLGDL